MSITDLLGIQIPIIQAPMAGAQDSALTIAVCRAGGLGSLPCAMLDAETLRREVATIRSASSAPFNLNFFCHNPPQPQAQRESAWLQTLAPYFEEFAIDVTAIGSGASRQPFSDESAALVETLKPAVVSFHFGLPDTALLARVKDSGAKILASATTVAEALWLEGRGVDAIIAQGWEAGGHRGHFLSADLSEQMGSLALLPQIVRRVRVPVIAAGGIADAAGVAAALRLGAAAVQLGTVYLLCEESRISPLHRVALQSDQRLHTEVTNVFTGRPARGIVNRLMRELGPINANVPDFPLAATAISALRSHQESAGSSDFSPLWAGQNCAGCREISATQLTRELLP